MSVSYGGDSITFSDNSVISTGYTGFKNRVINGSMMVWQRNTSSSNVTTTNAFFTADRFCNNRNSDVAGGSVARSTDAPTGFQYSLKMSRAAGNALTGGLYTFYSFESRDILDLKGKQVTLSFYAKVGENYTGSSTNVVLSYGTGTDERVYQQTSATYAVNTSFTPTTSWQRFSFTGTLGSNMGDLGFFVYSGAHSGTAGADDSIYLTGFQLEQGTTASSFEYRPYGTELALCQRYYARMPLTGTYSLEGYQGATGYNRCLKTYTPFPVTMRTTPNRVVITTGSFTNIRASSTSYCGLAPQSPSHADAFLETNNATGLAAYSGGVDAMDAEL